MVAVTFSPKSRQDLLDIGDYIARDSSANAHRFLDKLVAQCKRIGNAPTAFPVSSHAFFQAFKHAHGFRRRQAICAALLRRGDLVFGAFLAFGAIFSFALRSPRPCSTMSLPSLVCTTSDNSAPVART